MDGLDGRPQDYLGPGITVGVAEISNDDPHRSTQEPDQSLVAALQGGGRFKPLLVTRSPSGRLVLLGGERRYNALRDVGRAKTTVHVANDLAGLLAWLELDTGAGSGTARMSRSEVAAFSAKATFLLRLNAREVSRMDKVLGALFDYSAITVQNTRQLVNQIARLQPGIEREQVAHDLALVDEGLLAPSSAISRAAARRKAAAYVAGSVPPLQQAQTLKRVLPGLRGTVEALRAMGAVSPEIPMVTRDQAEKELREAYRLLAGIAKDLKTIRENA